MFWKILHLIAAIFGLSSVLAYIAIWYVVFIGGGLGYFTNQFGWFERSIEPFILAIGAILLATSAIRHIFSLLEK